MPPSPSASTSSNLRSTDRVRAESLKSRVTPKGDSPIHLKDSLHSHPTPSSSKSTTRETPASQPRPKSLLGSTSRPRPMSYPARPNSPLPPPRPHSPLPPLTTETKLKSRPAISTSTSHSVHKPSPQLRSPERERGHSRAPSSPSPSPGQRPASRQFHDQPYSCQVPRQGAQ
ncbi:hypothetical protein C8R46DRAFT_22658 [Mycena filopes]|nr:hypothetical protein C8R46DRAFT_22658 [Mycena filopes]